MPTRLILIRHGQTPWSLEKRYCSHTNIDINNTGKKQAKKLGERLRREEIHNVYSSNAKRALNFAKIAFKNFRIQKVAELREINFGIFDGLTYGEIMQRYPEIYIRWLNNPFSVDIPKGESMKDFKTRVAGSLKKIISHNKNKTCAIVTHAGAIKVIVSGLLKSKDIWKIKFDWGSISVIEFKSGRRNILLLNDTSYLKD